MCSLCGHEHHRDASCFIHAAAAYAVIYEFPALFDMKHGHCFVYVVPCESRRQAERVVEFIAATEGIVSSTVSILSPYNPALDPQHPDRAADIFSVTYRLAPDLLDASAAWA